MMKMSHFPILVICTLFPAAQTFDMKMPDIEKEMAKIDKQVEQMMKEAEKGMPDLDKLMESLPIPQGMPDLGSAMGEDSGK